MAFVTLLGVVGFGAVRTYFNVYMDVVLSVSATQIAVIAALSQLLILPACSVSSVLQQVPVQPVYHQEFLTE